MPTIIYSGPIDGKRAPSEQVTKDYNSLCNLLNGSFNDELILEDGTGLFARISMRKGQPWLEVGE